MSSSRLGPLLALVAPLSIVCAACGGSVAAVDAPRDESDEKQEPVGDPDPSSPSPSETSPPSRSASGYCTTTSVAHSPKFGGVEGGDAICARELPGSHFYRRSWDELRPFKPAVAKWPLGYGEIEQGECWNCSGWTSDSGDYRSSPSVQGCAEGYRTVAALVPQPLTNPTSAAWRICEAGDWPLTCCVP